MSELYHYGIPRRSGRYPYGSGERPYQHLKEASKGDRSYFRGAHTIPKGTIVYRTTSGATDLQTGSTYVTYLEPDRNLYKGGQIRLRDNSSSSYEHQIELKEDLKVPSRDVVKSTAQTVVKNNPSMVKEIAEGWIESWLPEGSFSYYEAFWDDNIHGVSQKKIQDMINNIVKNYKDKTIDEAFAMNMQSMGTSPKFKQAIIDSLKKQGYNAMVDEAGVGMNIIEGVDPLIIFDSDKSLGSRTTSQISSREEIKARNDYAKWVRKARVSRNKTGGGW